MNNGEPDNVITLKNPRTVFFYQNNPQLDPERVNLLVLELIENFNSDKSQIYSELNSIKEDIISSLIDASKSFKKKRIDFARIISHSSFGLLVMFIGLNDIFSVEKDYNIKLGETKNFDNYSIELQNLEIEKFSNYKAVIGSLEIKNNKTNKKNILKPEIRIYENPQTLTYEAAIKTSVLKDYYLTMSNIDRSDYYNIKFQKKPLMIWIWISVIMIAFGGFLRLFQNAKYN